MAAVTLDGIDALRELVGREVGPTDWREITQAEIDAFADLADDHQWIHTDPERAARESPYGTTVAHGNLTLSKIDGMRRQLIEQRGVVMGINYGWNKVRFPAPVPSGSRIRAIAEVVSVDELGDGWWHVVTRFRVDVEGSEKPACVADAVGRVLAR
jgi:acyl dehydratase